MNKFKFGDKVLNSDGVLGVVTNVNDELCFVAWSCHELDEAWHPVSELALATDWVKCSERLPEFGIEVLVFDGCDIEKDHVDVCAETCEEYFVNYGDTITHWMPLPAPPTEVER